MSTHGRCMCGGVQFTVDSEPSAVVNCHCYRCRQWSGHYWASTYAATGAVHIADAGTLRWYSPANGVEYGFCNRCGSSLFWRITERPDLVSMSAGCLDQPTGLHTKAAVWVAEHADYHPHHPDIVEHQYESE